MPTFQNHESQEVTAVQAAQLYCLFQDLPVHDSKSDQNNIDVNQRRAVESPVCETTLLCCCCRRSSEEWAGATQAVQRAVQDGALQPRDVTVQLMLRCMRTQVRGALCLLRV